MTVEGRPVLAEYAAHGWALVPIPTGRKGPLTARWNQRELCITDPALAEWLDGNVGLAHAYSGTCAIDVDDLDRTLAWLAERNIDLREWLDAPDAVRIESRPGRAKLLYRIEKPLPSFKLPCGLELRCAATNGLTVQDVLPPSIHPDTGQPYTWAYNSPVGHWSELPPLPGPLANLWHGLIAPTAPRVPKPVVRSRAVHADSPRLLKLLDLHDPDAGYDSWLAVGMALHHESGGAPAGLELWNTWSAQGQKYKGIGDLEQHWRSFRLDHANPRTLASLRTETAAAATDFPDLPPEGEPARAPAAGLSAPMRAPAKAGPGSPRDIALQAMRSVRRTKLGTIEARISNIVAVLGVPEVSGYDLAFDDFQDAVMVSPIKGNEWRPLTDTDYTTLRVWLETAGNCDPISHDMIRSSVQLVAERNRMDTAQIWLAAQKWDGIERIDTFCPRYLGTPDTPYTRAVGVYLWTALAGRVLSPGCQADMVPVLIGRQGVGKSRGVQALVPSPEHYVELRLDEPDDAIARKCRGTLVGELAEMRGLRAADIERVKAFITRTHERWVPKYKEFATNYPRRFIIVGTTNDEEFLPADTEHRRWLPMHTHGVDVAAIRDDREQLWAEASLRYTTDGIFWRGMDSLAVEARNAASGEDGWQDQVYRWIGELEDPTVPLKMQDVLVNAVGLDPRITNRAHELRVARILRSMGYERRTIWENKRAAKVWALDPTNAAVLQRASQNAQNLGG